MPAEGPPGPEMALFRGNKERLARVDIRTLAMRGSTLWAATSAGLLKADNPRVPGKKLQLLDTRGSFQAPVRRLVVHPETDELWMIADAQEDVPARVVGYDPDRDSTLTLTQDHGLPSNLPLHDLAFTDQGELVVLVGDRLFKGRVSVAGPGGPIPYVIAAATALTLVLITWFTIFRHPLVAEGRTHPGRLRQKSLSDLAVSLRRLRRAWALEEVRRRLDLSPERMNQLQAIAAHPAPEAAALRHLASLLGMTDTPHAETKEPYPGLCLLHAHLDYPKPLKKRTIPLFGLNPGQVHGEDETHLREAVQTALQKMHHCHEY